MEEKIDEFKDVIKDIKECVKTYEKKTTWIRIPNKNQNTKHIWLFESTNEKGTYLLKCQAVLKDCDPLKILKLNNDNNFETRKRWETGELINIEQLETLVDENINIIRYYINIPVPLVYDREFLGLQWYDYNEKHKLHRLLHKTVNYDEKYPCDTEKYVAGNCQTVLLISERDNDSIVTIYTYVQPNGYIPDLILPLWKEKLRNRMFLYETLAKSEDYNKIYMCKRCEEYNKYGKKIVDL